MSSLRHRSLLLCACLLACSSPETPRPGSATRAVEPATDLGGVGACTPASVVLGETALLTVQVTPGENPTSTGLAVTADLGSFGGVAQQGFVDDGTDGDVTAGDHVFSHAMVVAPAAPLEIILLVSISDAEGRHALASIGLDVQPAAQPVPTATTISSSSNPSVAGQSLTFTALVTVNGAPLGTGTVAFWDGDALLAEQIPLVGGKADFSTAELQTGSRPITAVYSGSSFYAGSRASLTQDIVAPVPEATQTTLSSSQNPSQLGESVTFTASVRAGDAPVADGTVTFWDGDALLAELIPLVGGQAAFSTADLQPGARTITAVYSGSPFHAGSQGSVTQIISFPEPAATQTEISSSVNPALAGQSITFTALVRAGGVLVNQGQATFWDGDAILAEQVPLVGGQADFTTTGLGTGSRTITAVFAGTSFHAGSQGSMIQVIIAPEPGATQTGLSSSVNPSRAGESVTFTAAVTANGAAVEGGAILFKEGDALLAGPTLVVAGKATFATVDLAVGAHTITAFYSGTSFVSPSAGSVIQIVIPPTETTLSAAPSPSALGQSVSFTATVTSNDQAVTEGTVTFKEGEQVLAGPVPLDGGTAVFSTATLALGTHTITAAYSGTATLEASDGSATHVVQNVVVIGDARVTEGDSGTIAADFTVSLAAPQTAPVSFTVSVAGVTAVAGVDFVAFAPTTLTLAPGATTATVSVQVIGDLTYETNESFTVNLSSAVNAMIGDGQASGVIVDNDPPPVLSIEDQTVVEGNSGTTALRVTVSLSRASGRTASVHYATAGETATAGSDYTAPIPGTLTFLAGVDRQTITVPIRGDLTLENDETFVIQLSDALGATIGDAEGRVTIDNDDGSALSIDDVDVREPITGTASATFTVTLAGSPDLPVSVTVATVFGTAHPGEDYTTMPPTTVVFTPGQTSKQIAVTILSDALPERVEGFTMTLTSPSNGVRLATSEGECQIQDSTFRIDGLSPGSAPVGASVTITGNRLDLADRVAFTAPKGSVSVTVIHHSETEIVAVVPAGASSGPIAASTSSGVAATSEQIFHVTPAITSFSPTSGMVGTPVQLSGVSLEAVSSVKIGGVEARIVSSTYATVSITVPAGAATGPITLTSDGGTASTQGLVPSIFTVTAQNPTPSISIDDLTIAEGDSGTKTVRVTLRLSGPSGDSVTVSYATADDTARAGSDYTATTGSVQFPLFALETTFDIPIRGDTVLESGESFFINLSAPSFARIADAQGKVTITNDDRVSLSIDVFGLNVLEPGLAPSAAGFTVTMTGSSDIPVTVMYETVEGTADAHDYTSVASTALVFAPGEGAKPIAISILGDDLLEPLESFSVRLSSPSNGAVLSNRDGQCTIRDNSFRIDGFSPTRGKVGTSVTITGNLLDRATGVSFSGAPGSSFQHVSATQLVAIVNDGALTGPIRVLRNNGAATSADIFHVPPAITSFSPTSGMVGTPVVINGTNLGGTSSVKIDGVAAAISSVTGTAVSIHVPPGATTGVIEITNPDGVASTKGLDPGVFTVTAQNPTPTMSIDDVTIAEGSGGGASLAHVKVRLSGTSGQVVTVSYATASDSAVAGSDFDTTSGVLQLPAFTTEGTIDVRVRGDATLEADESFVVNLSAASGANIGDAQARVTVVNDDAVILGIDDIVVAEPLRLTAAATFTVTMTGSSEIPVTVRYETVAGTAGALDFTSVAATALVFAPGEASKQVSIAVLADSVVEPGEAFLVRLSSPSAGASLSDREGQCLIADSTFRINSFSPTMGPVGSSVTITGNRLDLVTGVDFAGAGSASFQRVSATQIVATVNADASTGPIKILRSGGSATSADSYRVTPAITSFSPTSGPVGATVTIRGTSLAAVSSVEVNGVAARIISFSSTLVRIAVPAGATTGPITLTTPDGTATTSALSPSVFTVNPG